MRCFLRSAGLAGLMFLIILLASCNNAVADSNNDNTPKSAADVGDILVFYGPDGLGDSSYVDKFCIGAHKAALEHGLSVYDVSPTDWTAAETLAKEFIKLFADLSSDKNMSPVLFIFADSNYLQFLSDESMLRSIPKCLKLLIFDTKESELPLLNTVYMPLYGASYLAGVAAKTLLTKPNPRVVSLIANNTMQPLADSLNGFIDGYGVDWNGNMYNRFIIDNTTDSSSDKSATLSSMDFMVFCLSTGSVEETDRYGFNSADKVYSLAQIIQNISPFDLYFPICGGSVHGLLRYNREHKSDSFYTVGMDSDLSVYTSQVPFSVVKNVDLAVEKCVTQWVKDGKIPHHQNFGLESGYISLEISKNYKTQLSAAVQDKFQTAIAKEREYEQTK